MAFIFIVFPSGAQAGSLFANYASLSEFVIEMLKKLPHAFRDKFFQEVPEGVVIRSAIPRRDGEEAYEVKAIGDLVGEGFV